MYNKDYFDSDKDGIISEAELALQERIIALENSDKKSDQQRNMARTAMISILVVTIILFLPILDTERVNALSDIITMFYISMAGVIAAFFGSSAYMTVNKC